jgi:hypothetical protein
MGALGACVWWERAGRGESEEVGLRIMRAKVQRSSIVHSRGIGRSTLTAWCFVQAGFPVQGGPDQYDRVSPVPHRHIARTSSASLGPPRT